VRELLAVAHDLRAHPKPDALRGKVCGLHSMRRVLVSDPFQILAMVFYEPSTRTQSSFTSAMPFLGGNLFPLNQVRHIPDQVLAFISPLRCS
jgi:ornithine carbamoyltransferase